jgi:hypothetical protein
MQWRRWLRPRRRIGQRPQPAWTMLLLLLLTLALGLYLYLTSFTSLSTTPTSSNPPSLAVDQFYRYEQRGDYGSAWELFHPMMKQKFTKEAYIQQRAHLFMEHLGAATFSFELGQAASLSTWQFGKQTLRDIYQIPVTQTFHTTFGDFTITQNAFVIKEKDQWQLLWPFSK